MTAVYFNFARTESTRAYSKLYLRFIPFHMAIGTIFFPFGVFLFYLGFSSLFYFLTSFTTKASGVLAPQFSKYSSIIHSILILHLSVISLHCPMSKFAGFLGKVKEEETVVIVPMYPCFVQCYNNPTPGVDSLEVSSAMLRLSRVGN